MSIMDPSAEVDIEEEEESEKVRQPTVIASTAWASVDKIKELLHREAPEETSRSAKRKCNEAAVHASKDLTREIWSRAEDMEEDAEVNVSTEGSMKMSTACPPTHAEDCPSKKRRTAQPPHCFYYGGLTEKRANIWFSRLVQSGLDADTRSPRPKPNAEQQFCIRTIIDRCLKECLEEANDVEFRSEPLKLCVHGVPGAGKSEVLYWLRDFFENVCQWTHGVEFAYVAFQHSMVAYTPSL